MRIRPIYGDLIFANPQHRRFSLFDIERPFSLAGRSATACTFMHLSAIYCRPNHSRRVIASKHLKRSAFAQLV